MKTPSPLGVLGLGSGMSSIIAIFGDRLGVNWALWIFSGNLCNPTVDQVPYLSTD